MTSVSLLFIIVLAAEDTESVGTFLLHSVEDKYASELSKATSLVAKAETDAMKMSKAAAESRIRSYREKLAEITKTGDFDKALAIKNRIIQLEKELDALITSRVEKPPKHPRPKDTIRFQGHTYALIKDPATWHIAKQKCEEMGGRLVCINSTAESEFIASLCGKQLASIGACDELREGDLLNVDGTIPSFHTTLPKKQELEHWVVWDGNRFLIWQSGGRLHYVCEWAN